MIQNHEQDVSLGVYLLSIRTDNVGVWGQSRYDGAAWVYFFTNMKTLPYFLRQRETSHPILLPLFFLHMNKDKSEEQTFLLVGGLDV